MEKFNSKMMGQRKRWVNFDERTIEMTWSEQQRETRLKNSSNSNKEITEPWGTEGWWRKTWHPLHRRSGRRRKSDCRGKELPLCWPLLLDARSVLQLGCGTHLVLTPSHPGKEQVYFGCLFKAGLGSGSLPFHWAENIKCPADTSFLSCWSP